MKNLSDNEIMDVADAFLVISEQIGLNSDEILACLDLHKGTILKNISEDSLSELENEIMLNNFI